MTGLLAGRVALVTGGSSGIGAAVVRTIVREGGRALLTHVGDGDNADSLVASLADGSAAAMESDAADPEAMEQAARRCVDELDGLDILVACAGITRDRVLWKQTEEDWQRVLDVNLSGVFHALRAVTPQFRNQNHGKVVAVSSINGLRGKFGQAAYSASKAGVIGLCKSAARELARHQVNINVVCPGIIATPMTDTLPDDARKASVDEVLLKRMGTPEDVAEVIVFLCSDRARHVHGAVIQVDGGQYL